MGKTRRLLHPGCSHERDGTCHCQGQLSELAAELFGEDGYSQQHPEHKKITARAQGHGVTRIKREDWELLATKEHNPNNTKGTLGRAADPQLDAEFHVVDTLHLACHLRRLHAGIVFAGAHALGVEDKLAAFLSKKLMRGASDQIVTAGLLCLINGDCRSITVQWRQSPMQS